MTQSKLSIIVDDIINKRLLGVQSIHFKEDKEGAKLFSVLWRRLKRMFIDYCKP